MNTMIAAKRTLGISREIKRKTVSVRWLTDCATALEDGAAENLPFWTVLGLANRYGEQMGKAAVLRRATDIKSIADRRAFLRANGVIA